jgi:hypothetical protein
MYKTTANTQCMQGTAVAQNPWKFDSYELVLYDLFYFDILVLI